MTTSTRPPSVTATCPRPSRSTGGSARFLITAYLHASLSLSLSLSLLSFILDPSFNLAPLMGIGRIDVALPIVALGTLNLAAFQDRTPTLTGRRAQRGGGGSAPARPPSLLRLRSIPSMRGGRRRRRPKSLVRRPFLGPNGDATAERARNRPSDV